MAKVSQERGGCGLAFRQFDGFFLNFLSGHIVEGLHAEAELAVFHVDDFDFYLVADCQDSSRSFDPFLADLRKRVNQTRKDRYGSIDAP